MNMVVGSLAIKITQLNLKNLIDQIVNNFL